MTLYSSNGINGKIFSILSNWMLREWDENEIIQGWISLSFNYDFLTLSLFIFYICG